MEATRTSRYHDWENNEEIRIFREYLRIPSVHPDIDYDGCVDFLRRQAASLGLPCEVVEVNPRKPVVIISWQGTDPSATSIILNSHMDVVPVYPERWSHPPFGAHMDAEGRIYARGSQDMKCVGVQFMAVIRALLREGVHLRRTLHVLFVPDEEIGSQLGMRDFVRTDSFRRLNCGFALDEGYASESEVFRLFYGERTKRCVRFHVAGTPGHGSLLLEGTAGEKARRLLDFVMDFRDGEREKLERDPNLTIGDVTSVNLTVMEGGVQSNVVPPELMLCFDIRVSNDVDMDEFEAKIEEWCALSGGGIRIEYELKDPVMELTKLDDSNPLWVAFKSALDTMGVQVKPQIVPAASDMRFLRQLRIPAIGFSAIDKTPVLMHADDEYLRADTFLRGIEIYKNIVVAVANVE